MEKELDDIAQVLERIKDWPEGPKAALCRLIEGRTKLAVRIIQLNAQVKDLKRNAFINSRTFDEGVGIYFYDDCYEISKSGDTHRLIIENREYAGTLEEMEEILYNWYSA